MSEVVLNTTDSGAICFITLSAFFISIFIALVFSSNFRRAKVYQTIIDEILSHISQVLIVLILEHMKETYHYPLCH